MIVALAFKLTAKASGGSSEYPLEQFADRFFFEAPPSNSVCYISNPASIRTVRSSSSIAA